MDINTNHTQLENSSNLRVTLRSATCQSTPDHTPDVGCSWVAEKQLMVAIETLRDNACMAKDSMRRMSADAQLNKRIGNRRNERRNVREVLVLR